MMQLQIYYEVVCNAKLADDDDTTGGRNGGRRTTVRASKDERKLIHLQGKVLTKSSTLIYHDFIGPEFSALCPTPEK